MGSALPAVMQDSHGQPGFGACISWLPTHASSIGACCLPSDSVSGLLNAFPHEFSWQWLLDSNWYWVFTENLQWLNWRHFFSHPWLGHLHNKIHAWGHQRGGPRGTREGIVYAWCLSSLTRACCLFTYWVHSVTMVAILNHLWLQNVLEKASSHWVLLWDKLGITLRLGSSGPGQSAVPLVCLQFMLLCEFCCGWWRCASQGTVTEKSGSGHPTFWRIVFIAQGNLSLHLAKCSPFSLSALYPCCGFVLEMEKIVLSVTIVIL